MSDWLKPPFYLQVIFLWNCVSWTGITYGDYRFPAWAEFVGWMLCIASIGCVPGYAIYRYVNLEGTVGEVNNAILYATLYTIHYTLYYTILYYTILYYTILYYTILYYTILYYTILYYTILYYTILYYTILYYIILYCTVPYRTVPYRTVLYCAVLRCAALQCTALHCTVLYCTILYYTSYSIHYTYQRTSWRTGPLFSRLGWGARSLTKVNYQSPELPRLIPIPSFQRFHTLLHPDKEAMSRIERTYGVKKE